MKLIIVIIIFFLFTTLDSKAQIKVVTGRVIDEDLETIPGAMIQNSDTILLGKTDIEGQFKIEIPMDTDTLYFRFVAMEWKTIRIFQECNNIDVILMYDVSVRGTTPYKS